MKLLVALTCLLCAASAQPRPQRPPQPPPQQYNDADDFQGRQPQPPARPQGEQRYTTPVPIIRFDKEQGADGSYKTSYETGNNIVAEETGFLKNVGDKDLEALVQHGSYTYTAPDGSVITVTYTADEQGFRATGDHIPTPPPVPPEIQESLNLIYEGIRRQQEEEARNPKLQKLDQDRNDDDGNYPSPSRFGQ